MGNPPPPVATPPQTAAPQGVSYDVDPITGIVTVIGESGQGIGVLSPTAPPPPSGGQPPVIAPPSGTQTEEQPIGSGGDVPTIPSIPQPQVALNPIAQLDYEADYVKAHGGDAALKLYQDSLTQEQLTMYQQARGYTAPLSGILMPFVPAYDEAPVSQKIAGFKTKADWINAGSPLGLGIANYKPQIEPKKVDSGIIYEKQYDPISGQSIDVPILNPSMTKDQPFIMPADAKVVERDANGNPTVYEYKGELYYSPASTSYKQGFRTESDRIRDGGTRQVGLAWGSLVPDVTMVGLDAEGNPIRRYTFDEAEKGAINKADLDSGLIRFAMKDYGGKEVLLKPDQYDKFAKAETDEERLKVAKELSLVPQNWTLKDFTGETERERIAKENAENFVSVQEAKRYNEVAAKAKQGSQEEITRLASVNNFQVLNPSKLSLDQMEKLIENGLPPQLLVIAGNDAGKVNQAVDAINARYTEARLAIAKLEPYKIDIVGVWDIQYPKPITYDVEKYLRDHPTDAATIKSVYGDTPETQAMITKVLSANKLLDSSLKSINDLLQPQNFSNSALGWASLGGSIQNAFDKLGFKPQPVDATFDIAIGWWRDNQTQKILSVADVLPRQWAALSDAQKQQVAVAVEQDPYKKSVFAEINQTINIATDKAIADNNRLVKYLIAPQLAISNVIAKALTIKEARQLLTETYATELKAVASYVNPNGTINIDKLSRFADNPQIRDQILKDAGYPDFDTLKKNLEYYNNGIRVTGGEIAVAGAIGALDIMALGGGAVLASLGWGGKVAVSAIHVGAGAIFVPSAVEVVKSKDASIEDKVVGVATPILLIAGGVWGALPKGFRETTPAEIVRGRSTEAVIKGALSQEAIARAERAISEAIWKLERGNVVVRAAADIKTAVTNIPELPSQAMAASLRALDNAVNAFENIITKSENVILKMDVERAVINLREVAAKIPELPSKAMDVSLKALDAAVGNVEKLVVRSEGVIAKMDLEKPFTEIYNAAKSIPRVSLEAIKSIPELSRQAVEASLKTLDDAVNSLEILMAKAENIIVKADLEQAVLKVKDAINQVPAIADAAMETSLRALDNAVNRF